MESAIDGNEYFSYTASSTSSLPDFHDDPSWRTSGLTDAQDKALTIAMIPPSVLSIMGSSIICYLVAIQSRPDTVYKRLILGMSLCDIIFSVSFCLQAFLVPAETSPRVWAFGTDQTCSVTAFIGQVGTAGIWYNGCLSFYFLLTIRYNISESWMRKRVEPLMHIFSLTYATTTATIGLVMDWYHENELGGGCWLNEVPNGCIPEEMLEDYPDGEPCKTMLVGVLWAGIGFFVLFIALVVNNLLIYQHVKQTLQKPTLQCNTNNDRCRKKLLMVAWQCIWYVVVFWFAFIWLILVRFLEGAGFPPENEGQIFPLLLCQSLFTPLQGFLNLFIYTRPRYLHAKEEFPTETRWWTLKRALLGEKVQPQHSNASKSSRVQDMCCVRHNNNNTPPCHTNCNHGSSAFLAMDFAALESATSLMKGSDNDVAPFDISCEDILVMQSPFEMEGESDSDMDGARNVRDAEAETEDLA